MSKPRCNDLVQQHYRFRPIKCSKTANRDPDAFGVPTKCLQHSSEFRKKVEERQFQQTIKQLAKWRLQANAPKTAAERDRLKALNAELLAALREVLEVINPPSSMSMLYWGKQLTDTSLKIKAAIAKAEGRD